MTDKIARWRVTNCLFIGALILIPTAVRANQRVKNPDTYVSVTASEVNSLDPAVNGDNVSQGVILNLYDTLFAFDGPSVQRLLPLAAESVPTRENGLISTDGLTYTIPIRKGIRFHDGTALTAEDVRYSMLRFMIMDAGPAMTLLEPLTGYQSSRDASGKLRTTLLRDAERAVERDGDRVVLHLKRPFPPLLPILARWCPVVSKSWAVAHGDWDGTAASWTRYNSPKKEATAFFDKENGSGPFMLERWDRAAKQLVLSRYEGYWRGPAKLKRVVIKTVGEFATRRLMLQAGDADAIEADRLQLSQLRGLPGVEVIDGLPTFMVVPVVEFCFHLSQKANPYIGSGKLDGDGVPPDFFADRDVRKAFAYAFDYAGYIRDVLHGQGTRSIGFIPKGMVGYDPELPRFSFDPKKAELHFRRAFGGLVWKRGFRVAVVYPAGSATRAQIAQILKRGVESLNPKFRVDALPLDWPSFIDAQDRFLLPADISGHYAPYPDPHALAFQFMESDPAQQCGYSSAESDRLVDAALREWNSSRRVALYHRLLALEHEDVPFVTVADAPTFRVQRTWLHGWTYNPMVPTGGLFYFLSKSPRNQE